MEGNNRWRSVALTLLLIASPWLAVQGWIVAAAHDPEHTYITILNHDREPNPKLTNGTAVYHIA